MRRYLLPLIFLCLAGVWGSALVPDLGADEGSQTAYERLDLTLTLPGIHTDLTGSLSCIKCHDDTQRTNDAKCLDCHGEIQAALDRGRGYHHKVVIGERQACESCHKEHQGTEAKLTTWMDNAGMRAFDHGATGYALEGAHTAIECVACHRPQLMLATVSQRTSQDDSYLGMPTACVGCHDDSHTPSLGRECDRCHLVSSWDELVHDAPPDNYTTDLHLVDLHNCIPAHAGRDICKTCHQSGRYSDPLPYADCSDCHAGAHEGQLTDRPDGGRCEACHDVLGFESVRFGVNEHQETEFPLEGGHRAVSCSACHTRVMIDGVETVRLDIPDRECADCHTDPPVGHLTEIAERFTCKDCHDASSWHNTLFDHDQSEFRLSGRHLETTCVSCHQTADVGTPHERVRYVELEKDCTACHDNVHGEQFAEQRCEDCHTPDEWRPTLFDHQKDSSFALVGKHLEADCHDCHRMESDPDGNQFRRFKPLSNTDCRDCHGESGGVLPAFTETPGTREPLQPQKP